MDDLLNSRCANPLSSKQILNDEGILKSIPKEPKRTNVRSKAWICPDQDQVKLNIDGKQVLM